MAITKVAYEFDPFKMTGVEPPKSKRSESAAIRDVAEFVKTEVLAYVAESKSPVAGGSFKKSLSKEYKKRKQEQGGSSVADLELDGDLLNALEVTVKSGRKLSLQIVGEEAPKADGHNNHSGRSELPERIFIPKKEQTFKRDIVQGVKRILEEYADEE